MGLKGDTQYTLISSSRIKQHRFINISGVMAFTTHFKFVLRQPKLLGCVVIQSPSTADSSFQPWYHRFIRSKILTSWFCLLFAKTDKKHKSWSVSIKHVNPSTITEIFPALEDFQRQSAIWAHGGVSFTMKRSDFQPWRHWVGITRFNNVLASNSMWWKRIMVMCFVLKTKLNIKIQKYKNVFKYTINKSEDDFCI